MQPRPLYHWKSFWLGLFVGLFLVWAWHDSLTNAVGGCYGKPGGTGYMFTRKNGESFLSVVTPWFASGLIWNYAGAWDPRTDLRSMQEHGRVNFIRIPDAVVGISFVWLWCELLGWRWRQERMRLSSLCQGE
ncbi:hypothetical protein OKA04_12240 [Luteolibacter flavescens]|uniref:Uncharacterized protein n=1 Tax=Luteolibacter flavescens TaxID=1859460 RepID=A0ABT3FPJ6_9BACT|nr:hypothetical protein [Luteolibacter flavescens]MCW1885500.1 hypothetical protein [Luteolibacter flavescens]